MSMIASRSRRTTRTVSYHLPQARYRTTRRPRRIELALPENGAQRSSAELRG